jgi:transposase
VDTELLKEFLPELLLEHFDVVKLVKLYVISAKKLEYEMHLDERNQLPPGCTIMVYESKGFLPSSNIQDLPIRGKAVYLQIRRRRWRHKRTRKEITNNYSFVSEGSKLTRELSYFLKDTGRDPRRYAR